MGHIIAIQKSTLWNVPRDRLDAGTLHDVACAACIPDAALFESHVFFASAYQPAGIGLVTVFVPVEIKINPSSSVESFFVFFFCYV